MKIEELVKALLGKCTEQLLVDATRALLKKKRRTVPKSDGFSPSDSRWRLKYIESAQDLRDISDIVQQMVEQVTSSFLTDIIVTSNASPFIQNRYGFNSLGTLQSNLEKMHACLLESAKRQKQSDIHGLYALGLLIDTIRWFLCCYFSRKPVATVIPLYKCTLNSLVAYMNRTSSIALSRFCSFALLMDWQKVLLGQITLQQYVCNHACKHVQGGEKQSKRAKQTSLTSTETKVQTSTVLAPPPEEPPATLQQPVSLIENDACLKTLWLDVMKEFDTSLVEEDGIFQCEDEEEDDTGLFGLVF